MAGKDAMPTDFAGGFDFSALHNVLNDPNIKQMAEQVAEDPAFAQMSQALQASMQQNNLDAPGMPQAMDPTRYAEAMSSVLQNESFMKMAEKLGQQIMQQDPGMATLIANMQSAEYREGIQSKLSALKEDQEIAPILDEIEKGGPAAMMKYWNDPAVLEKLSKAMGGTFGDAGAAAEASAPEAEAEPEEDPDVHSAASNGEVETLKQLLKDGADKDSQDDEGRTPLHFASGYGEIECVKLLLAEKADVNLVDNNRQGYLSILRLGQPSVVDESVYISGICEEVQQWNQALHYAAGYGQADCVQLLLDSGASTSAKNLDDKTPLEVAQLNNQEEVVAVLSKAKA